MRRDVDALRVIELNRRFHDEVEADTYDQRMGVDHGDAATAVMLAELREVLGAPLPQGCAVLDVGAGTGNVAVKLARSGLFERVVAADISRGMLAVAEAAAERHGCALETVETDMERLPFPDGSFGLVVGCAFLHHLPDPVAFMSEVRRVLAPGAPFIFIGEPSTVGARITETVKLPLVAGNRVVKKLTRRGGLRWEHDNIDVHTFTPADVARMTADFERVRMAPAGFLEPIVDQGVLAPARLVLRHAPLIAALDGFQGLLRRLDEAWCNPRLPRGLLASVKFSGYKPA